MSGKVLYNDMAAGIVSVGYQYNEAALLYKVRRKLLADTPLLPQPTSEVGASHGPWRLRLNPSSAQWSFPFSGFSLRSQLLTLDLSPLDTSLRSANAELSECLAPPSLRSPPLGNFRLSEPLTRISNCAFAASAALSECLVSAKHRKLPATNITGVYRLAAATATLRIPQNKIPSGPSRKLRKKHTTSKLFCAVLQTLMGKLVPTSDVP